MRATLPIFFFGSLSLTLTACTQAPPRVPAVADGPTVQFETNIGAFEVVLYQSQAPETVANFVQYIDDGFYDGRDGNGQTIFHRVVPGFVVQGGGFTELGLEKDTRASIRNEAIDSGLSNVRGTLAMARTNRADSATSQFFINVVDNQWLDPGQGDRAGYAVFGEVTLGLEVITEMTQRPLAGEQPLDALVIERAVLLAP